jgi:hypothetical protein
MACSLWNRGLIIHDCWPRLALVPSRSVVEFWRATSMLILYLGLFGGIASADTLGRHELPLHAVAHGHNIQPRADQLQALGYSDLTAQEAGEVDRLYRELMKKGVVPGGAAL